MTNQISVSSIVLLLILKSSLSLSSEIPPNPNPSTPGMEKGAWSLESWGNSGAADKIASDIGPLLKIIYTSTGKDKCAFKHLTGMGMAPDGKMRLSVYSEDEKPPAFAIAISTTPAYRWHESKIVELKKGWNKFEFAVGDKNWKTAGSAWKHAVSVEPIDDVRAVDLLVFNGESMGVLYVQGLQYDLDPRGQQIAIVAKDLLSDDLELRANAEKALVGIGRPATEALYQFSDNDRPEVLLRAAAALRQIEAAKEEPPANPQILEELIRQKEEQSFDEARRRAAYTLRGLENERRKLLNVLKEAQTEITQGRVDLEKLKYADPEKQKTYTETLEKIEAILKEVEPALKMQKD